MRLIWQNAASLGIERHPERLSERNEGLKNIAELNEHAVGPFEKRNGDIEVVTGDAFLWGKKMPDLGTAPWLVFCSPPYEFYVSRKDDLLELLNRLTEAAPAESLLAVEADERFDFAVAEPDTWDVRRYPPAVVGIWEKRA